MKKCHIVVGFDSENPEGKCLFIGSDAESATEAFRKASADKSLDFVGFTRSVRWTKRAKPEQTVNREAEQAKALEAAEIIAATPIVMETEAPGNPDAEAEQAKALEAAEAAKPKGKPKK